MNLEPMTSPSQGTSVGKLDWRLTVDDTETGKRQSITGFGAAWTDATVAVFDSLQAEQQEQVLNDLFADQGIKLRLMRHTIGQSDMTPPSVGHYSYDENGGQRDASMSHFDLSDAGRGMVSWLVRMQHVQPDVVHLGSPWSPPSWMKHDNTIDWPNVHAWVDYMVKYLQEFKQKGVNVDAITIQNEPLHDGDSAWTTRIDASYATILTNKLGRAIQAAGLSTKIWAYDHNADSAGWNYVSTVIHQAGQHVSGVAWHCYSTNYWESPERYSMLTDFYNAHPNIPQYSTECWDHLKSEDFFNLPDFIQGPIRNYASGALAWVLGGSTDYDVAYPGGCDQCSGLVQVDMKAKSYEKTQDYYNLGQFSKFVNKGARYLYNEGGHTYPDGTGVQFTSYLNPDGSKVLVVLNKIYNDLHTEVHFKSGDVWNGVIPGRSVTTWVIRSASNPAEDVIMV